MAAGRTLVFTGNGKGKTTAALGMAMRACGHGIAVKVVQFVKADNATGELAAAEFLPGVEIEQVGMGFVPPESSPKYTEHRLAAEKGLHVARKALESGEYGLVVLDEVCIAVSLGLLDETAVLESLGMAAEDMVVVLTGRGATPALIDQADTVTEMREIKHAMNEGLPARAGVEY